MRNKDTYSVYSLNKMLAETIIDPKMTSEEKASKVISLLFCVEGYIAFNRETNMILFKGRDINELVSFSSSIIPTPSKNNHNYDKVLAAANITWQEEAFALRIINTINSIPDPQMRRYIYMKYVLKHTMRYIIDRLMLTQTKYYQYAQIASRHIIVRLIK